MKLSDRWASLAGDLYSGLRQLRAAPVLSATIGLGVARLASGVLRSLLFGVTPTDAATYVTGAVALFVVAIAAMTVPAVRASRIDPVRSLAN